MALPAFISSGGRGTVGVLFLLVLQMVTQRIRGDPEALQDFCVADTKSSVFTNGLACLNPNQVSSEHFVSSALRRTANTSAGPTGVNFIGVNPRNLPGLNTLGLTMARIDMDVGGIAAPHIHPRATELSYVVEGQILAAFVDSTTNKLFSQKLEPGDVFVVPKGTVHFAQNIGQTKAVAINALNSQNPGFLYIPAATFASNPSIPKEVLAKSFALSLQEVERIRKILGGT